MIGLVCPFLVPWMLPFDWRGNIFDASQKNVDQYVKFREETQFLTSDKVETKQVQDVRDCMSYRMTSLQSDLNNNATNDDTPKFQKVSL